MLKMACSSFSKGPFDKNGATFPRTPLLFLTDPRIIEKFALFNTLLATNTVLQEEVQGLCSQWEDFTELWPALLKGCLK